MKPPRILAIGGSDPSGGAGVQADIKTITMLGGYAMAAITAITVQNSVSVSAIQMLDPDLLAAQIDACADIGVDAIKIGMLGSAANAAVVASKVEALGVPIVFDPVMIASTGGVLADAATVALFAQLIAMATLTTPNVAELAKLHIALAGHTYLAKGGDAPGETVEDTLHRAGQAPLRFAAPRIATRHGHGTGCTLASAIATGLGAGLPLVEAIERARAFVRAALLAAPGYGAGHGPLGHAAAMGSGRLVAPQGFEPR